MRGRGYSREESRWYPLDGKLGEAQNPAGHVKEKNSFPLPRVRHRANCEDVKWLELKLQRRCSMGFVGCNGNKASDCFQGVAA